jgi:indole-3-glycerol phosphate synthase
MSGFLAQMTQASHVRAHEAMAREPLVALRARAADAAPAPPLRLDRPFELFAEYKRRSPVMGPLAKREEHLATRVTAYARGGAAAVSVLTEPERFDGSLADLSEAATVLAPLGVPAMRKDFLVDPYQLYEARAAGAGGVLLIVRMLSGEVLREMLDCARELQLFTLLETFDAKEIAIATAAIQRRRAADRTARVLLGVNCRDLGTLEVLPFRFRELAPLLPPDIPCVAESGIATADRCADVARAGYGSALVGGSLMSQADPIAAIRAMLATGRASARFAA